MRRLQGNKDNQYKETKENYWAVVGRALGRWVRQTQERRRCRGCQALGEEQRCEGVPRLGVCACVSM